MIVIDANAAFQIVTKSETGENLRSLFYEGEFVVAPDQFKTEMASVCTKYVRANKLAPHEAKTKIWEALSLVDRYYSNDSLFEEAVNESIKQYHSSHDMFYFVLARKLGATLATLDVALSKICIKNGIDCLYQRELDIPNVDKGAWTIRSANYDEALS